MKLFDKVKKTAKTIYRTSMGKNMITFCIFLAIASIFWIMTALNDEVQRSFTVPIQFQHIPKGVTLLNTAPIEVTVSMKNKGRAFLKYDWSEVPVLKINFNDFSNTKNNRIVINEQRLSSLIRGIFGNETDVISIRPDSISLFYTTLPGEKLPIHVAIDARTDPQYIVFGDYKLSTDSVMVYSVRGLPSNVVALNTQNVSLRNLNDSTTVEVPIEIPRGCRVEPPYVEVTIPVQPLVVKHKELPIKLINTPGGENVITFPSMVKVSYLIPKTLYNESAASLNAIVNYYDIDHEKPTVDVTIKNIPDYYRGVSVKPEEVEYIIEHKTPKP